MPLHHGFELLREQTIPEINTLARYYRHRKSGALLLSLINDDENKVFGITFRTPPPDSTGVAHILEHGVLCGSRKYRVKEPFVELLKGSLSTFLNAFTYPDKTVYPVASQNVQDFYNLIDVYMDAVLHPLIPPHVLQQEGWHYELEDPASPLAYKGVVFNEMKGAYSNPDDLLNDRARQSLFPDTIYRVDSGGDPRHIPELTYEQYKAFHERYYHPSNARIWFYGDDDPEERLRLMDAYLQDYEAIEVPSAIPLQPPWDQPRRVVETFDPGDDPANLKARLVVNWLLTETRHSETMLGLNILAHILLGTPASPLRKALIESGLGEDLAGVGLENELRQAYFSTGLKGLEVAEDYRPAKGEEVEALIFNTLRQLAEEGIDPETVAASLNTVEFRLRENNTGSFPRGLSLMLRSLTTWLYDEDPLAPLAFEAPLQAIKERLARGERYFEELIRRYFLENPHRTTLILQPEVGKTQRWEQEEKERLERVRQSLSQDDLLRLVEETRRLKELQAMPDPPEALAAIPRLRLEDLERRNKVIPCEVTTLEGRPLLYHDLFTNGIVYLDLAFDLRLLPPHLLPYVPLFGRALLEMGTAREDFVRLSQRIGRETGGIQPTSFVSMVRNTPESTAWFILRAKATCEKSAEMLAILRDVLLTANLDNPQRFRQIVLEEKAQKEAMLVPLGHRVVNTRLRALFNPADWAEEQMSGVSSLFFLRQLAQEVEQDWPSVLAALEEIRRRLLILPAVLANVTVDGQTWSSFQPQLADLLRQLPSHTASPAHWQPQGGERYEGLAIPAQVNYVGKGGDLYRYGYQAHGSVDVIANYLRTSYLWEKVRIQGGAYGGFCLFNHRSGVFTFLSYRDPNLLQTLEVYDATADYLRHLDLSHDELTRSIIGAIGDMDAHLLPDAKGFASLTRYLAGDTEESRQVWREQILGTTLQDFQSFGEVLRAVGEEGAVVVMGAAETLAQVNAQRGSWLRIQKIL